MAVTIDGAGAPRVTSRGAEVEHTPDIRSAIAVAEMEKAP